MDLEYIFSSCNVRTAGLAELVVVFGAQLRFVFSHTNLLQQRLGFWAQYDNDNTQKSPHILSIGVMEKVHVFMERIQRILPQELHSGNYSMLMNIYQSLKRQDLFFGLKHPC